MESVVSIVILIGLVALLIWLWLVPAIVAKRRRHPNQMAILVLTVLLGWTFLGWVVALVWASTAIPETRNAAVSP